MRAEQQIQRPFQENLKEKKKKKKERRLKWHQQHFRQYQVMLQQLFPQAF